MERFQSVGRLFLQLSFDLVIPAALGRSARSAPRTCTRCCGFQASETIPFTGADSIFSSRCGAISGQLRLPSDPLAPRSRRNASVQKFAPGWAREAATRPETKRPDDLKKHPSTNLVSPKEKSTKSTPPVRTTALHARPRAAPSRDIQAAPSRLSRGRRPWIRGVKPAHYEAESGALIFGRRRSLGCFALLEVTFEALRGLADSQTIERRLSRRMGISRRFPGSRVGDFRRAGIERPDAER